MKRLFSIALLIFVLSSLITPFLICQAQVASATLFISPSSGIYTVDRNFTVKVMVNSGGGIGINAAEGVINYDSSFLLISRVSESGSIFKLWTENPTYSNSEGRAVFGGGAPGSYTGDAGQIFTITFTAKKVGETEVKFSSGIVLAADGKGTNVFGGFGNAKYTIVPAEEQQPTTKPEEAPVKGILPPLPEISSASHPDENIWYSNNKPEFSWKLLSDLTGISYLIDEEPTTNPGNVSDGVIESERFEDISDGIKYFHLKFQNKVGWGQAAHKKFLVDVTPPEAFSLNFDSGGDPTNPSPKLIFSTTDETSGINYYNIIVGSETKQVSVEEAGNGYYQIGPLAPGSYEATVTAVDRAGNSATSSIQFAIEPLKPPIITNIPKIINKKEQLVIQGTSFYAGVKVQIYISQTYGEPIVGQVVTDGNGNWSYFHGGSLEKGNYEVWARIIDNRGAQSLDSTKHLLTVISPSIIDEYCWLIILILLLIIIGLIVYIFYQRKEFNEERMRIKKETDEVKDRLRKIFIALREEVDELIELADKKPGLSDNERRIKEKLQESLDISEEFISKEVADVEKEIKLKKEDSEK